MSIQACSSIYVAIQVGDSKYAEHVTDNQNNKYKRANYCR